MELYEDLNHVIIDGNGVQNSTIYNFSHLSENESSYIYEYDISEFVLPLGEIIPVAFVYGITLILGVSGNILVMFSVCRYQRMKTITNTFLVSLATTDLLLIIVCVPSKVRN